MVRPDRELEVARPKFGGALQELIAAPPILELDSFEGIHAEVVYVSCALLNFVVIPSSFSRTRRKFRSCHWARNQINRQRFINRTCQWFSVVNSTHILQCARAHDCIGYHLLSVNENPITRHPFIYYQLI